MRYNIRHIKTSEYPLLETFLYEAIFQRDRNNLLPYDIIQNQELQVYIKDFGKETDYCFVAEKENKIIGCVWTRIMAGETKGYGNIDDETPEFTISILRDYRGFGIGTSLMKAMIELLRKEGFTKASLSVQKDNYAFKMYKKLGFYIIEENDEDVIMILNLTKQ